MALKWFRNYSTFLRRVPQNLFCEQWLFYVAILHYEGRETTAGDRLVHDRAAVQRHGQINQLCTGKTCFKTSKGSGARL